ncbi:phosphoenolpyruvate--protein phosphotransferase [Hydrogenispora ethanolica]|uniref:Phosphoenolpyruvate-protein phosphotransferase n=1 Tax=Hydrogenispora ethanolica TaxID=1082276 RepID=A0A4R1RI73_HYDET|nr:phosphoenolpyruvate--protein phosphotransferase [Hydrogenispora ethanolica]TCL65342.1 phosphoenolpyruvate--protein phosphotransferase [Hydrogenispora ethanolica]
MIQGIPASAGIAIGNAYRLEQHSLAVVRREIADPGAEQARFQAAVDRAASQIAALVERAKETAGPEQAAIFEAHGMMLADPELQSAVAALIASEKVNAEYALKTVMDQYIDLIGQAESDYLKERAADLRDVAGRVTAALQGVPYQTLSGINDPVILVADDLLPSETAQLDRSKVLGIVTALGGPTSHTAIMARTFGLPAVVGAAEAPALIRSGDPLIVDGAAGRVIVQPAPEEREAYAAARARFLEERAQLAALKNAPAVTRDGHPVELAANIGGPKEVPLALEHGATAIGLFRTEFLYMDQASAPSEEQQFKAYQSVLAQMGERPVIVRTLDIGGDKQLPYLPIGAELNPFLGYRALRLCLDRRDLFKTQLRAIYRASVHGNLRIMFPMVSGVEELRAAKAVAAEVREELAAAGIPFRPDVPLGIMIEIPAAALISDLLAQEADFFSIGTNDLIQYSLAVDRTNQKVAALYNPFHPGVLRLLKLTVDNAHRAGKWVGLCGETGGDPRLIPVLVGLGLDELSMNAGALPAAKKRLRELDFKACAEHARHALGLATAAEIEAYLAESIR